MPNAVGEVPFTGSRDEALAAVAPVAYGLRSDHAHLNGAWDPSPGLTLPATGAMALDVDSVLGLR